MKLKVEISVRENDPWPRGGTGALRRDLTYVIQDAVQRALREHDAELTSLAFVRPRS